MAGISMEVIKVSVYYNTPQGLNVVDMAAACPIGESQHWHNHVSAFGPRVCPTNGHFDHFTISSAVCSPSLFGLLAKLHKLHRK